MANIFDEIDPRGGSRQQSPTSPTSPASTNNPFDEIDPRGGQKPPPATAAAPETPPEPGNIDPMSGVRIGADLERTAPEAFPNRLTRGVIQYVGGMPQGAAELPKRAYESAKKFSQTGEYDPAPIMEGALLTMGTGAGARGGWRTVSPPPPGTPPPLPVMPPPLPPEVSAIPRQVDRPRTGVGLLNTDVPHELPGAQSRGLSAAGNGGPLSGMSPDTIAFLRQKMEQQGFNQHTIDQRLGEMSAHHFFGEITPSLELDMSGVAGHAGPGRLEVMNSQRQRHIEAPERAGHALTRAFGESENIPQMQRIMDIERKRETGPLYRAFRNTEITPTPEIDALLPRLQAAGVLQDANRALRIEGRETTHGFTIPGEPPTTQRVPTAGAFQTALVEISGKVGKAIRAGDMPEAARLTELRHDLTAALDTHPNVGNAWREARTAHATPKGIEDAIKMGRNWTKVSGDELPFLTSHYSEPELRGFRVGIHQSLRDMLGKRDTLTAELHNTILSPNNEAKLRWAIGDEAAERLLNEFQHERHMHGAQTRATGNSPTASRTQAMNEWNGATAAERLGMEDMVEIAKKPIRSGIGAALKFRSAQKQAANEAKWARIREEASRVMTLQGPERDAVARYLVGGVEPPPYRKGGRVTQRKASRAPRSNLAPRAFGGRVRGYADGGELPDVGEPLIGDGGEFSPGIRPVNKVAEGLSRALTHGMVDVVKTPGILMQPNPYPPGSEEASWYDDQKSKAATDWGASMALNTMGTGAVAGVPVKGAEAVLGSGAVRTKKGTVDVPARTEAGVDVGPGLAGPSGGGEGLRAAELQAQRWAGERAPLEGLPRGAQIVEGQPFIPGPVARAHDVAERYMEGKDFGVAHPQKYHPIDVEHAKDIAKAFDEMAHAPGDPKVKAAYQALADETLAQYNAIVEHGGLKVTPVNAADYPYHGNPRAVVKDVADNNHMAFFKTDEGFGSTPVELAEHPLLRPSGIKVGDHEMLYNDLFRVVHDYFGHVKNGYGFRGAGEDNAWRAHAAMYSPQARHAMTTETRGQNSWLNYGPHGEHNRTANAVDTIYAPQKIGLLPEWVMQDRAPVAPAKKSPPYYEGDPVINAGVDAPPNRKVQTVADPHRMMFPGVYRNPRVIAEEAASRVGPENPAMQQLFGVTRGDLRDMAAGRVGNEEPKLSLAPNARGSLSTQNIQTPRNTQRLNDILGEAGKHEGLRTADAWYIMDPLYQRLEQMFGPEEAARRYKHLNTTTAMASPGSDVLTEIQRGTAAHWLQNEGRFKDFIKYGGLTGDAKNSLRVPRDVRYIGGHPYHRTSQAEPMQKYFDAGSIQSEAPKVPLYAHASGVPETGFQTTGPVGDAHFSRGVGLADTRKGPTDVGSSFSRPEYQTLQPWWQHEVAGKSGLESVPAQARLWTALGPQTGVESALGAPKLELLAQQIMKAARRLGVSPETARDLILSGKAGAGAITGAVVAPRFFQPEERTSGGRVAPRVTSTMM